ncbi:MFS transporter [Actinomadura rugatobispora]|uniref:MFS transporter n=1 Tax=Actinomadura rugatobispora TaxID=1994 RepID=A0ABW1A8G3_9ACTN|nr:hypothetical protein GCM10010200_018830 [Actinomadura rugatobispora]
MLDGVGPPDRPDRWRREFGWLWLGSAASTLGGTSVAMTAPLLALAESESAVVTGAVFAAGTLPNLLYLPAGLVVDRFDERRTMQVSLAVRLAVAVAMVCVTAAGRLHVSMLLCAAALSGICTTFYNVAETKTVPRLVPVSHRKRAAATNELRGNLSSLVGRLLGGALAVPGRSTMPFAIDAALSTATLATLFTIRSRLKRTTTGERPQGLRGLGPDFTESAVWLWRRLFLRTVLITCTLTNALFSVMVLILMVRTRDQGEGSWLIGLILGAPALGGFIAACYTAKPRFGWLRELMPCPREPSTAHPEPAPAPATETETETEPVSQHHRLRFLSSHPLRMVSICLGSWLVLTSAIPLTGNPWIWLIAWGGVGFVGTLMNIALNGYQSVYTPEAMRGRVNGVVRFCTMGGTSIGTVVGGPLVFWIGATAVAWCVPGAIAILAAVLWGAWKYRVRRPRDRALPSPPVSDSPDPPDDAECGEAPRSRQDSVLPAGAAAP